MTRVTRPSRSLQTRAVRAGARLGRRKFTAGTLVAVRNDDYILMVKMHRDRGRWGLPGGFSKGAAPA